MSVADPIVRWRGLAAYRTVLVTGIIHLSTASDHRPDAVIYRGRSTGKRAKGKPDTETPAAHRFVIGS